MWFDTPVSEQLHDSCTMGLFVGCTLLLCSYPVPAANPPLVWENSMCPSCTVGMRLGLVCTLKGCREMCPCFSHGASVAGLCFQLGHL